MTEPPQFLKRMIVSAINAREVESARVSSLLHDEVGQVLSAVGLQLEVMKLDYRAQLPEITERIHGIQAMLELAVCQVRALSYDLNPAIVQRAGLPSALDRLVGRFRTSFHGSIRLACDSSVRVPADVANVWYKIAELAVENSVQHSGAKRIEVQIRSTSRHVHMEVRDDGCGFSTEIVGTEMPGLGLMLIEHYASQAPVEVEVKSKPGKGTVVRSSWTRPRTLIEVPEP